MQFTDKLTEADMSEVRKMTRSKFMYCLEFFATYLCGAGVLVYVAGLTISGLLGHTKPNWPAIALGWVAAPGISLLAVYVERGTHSCRLRQLNAVRANLISLTNDGMKFDRADGATALMPWRDYKGWREGRRVMLIVRRRRDRVVILPVAQLSEIERQPIRQFLQSHIPPVSQ
jgi:hypothetical protein